MTHFAVGFTLPLNLLHKNCLDNILPKVIINSKEYLKGILILNDKNLEVATPISWPRNPDTWNTSSGK